VVFVKVAEGAARDRLAALAAALRGALVARRPRGRPRFRAARDRLQDRQA
jgi:hypothetical protein